MTHHTHMQPPIFEMNIDMKLQRLDNNKSWSINESFYQARAAYELRQYTRD